MFCESVSKGVPCKPEEFCPGDSRHISAAISRHMRPNHHLPDPHTPLYLPISVPLPRLQPDGAPVTTYMLRLQKSVSLYQLPCQPPVL